MVPESIPQVWNNGRRLESEIREFRIQEPGAGSQEPEARSQKPGARSQEPGHQVPGFEHVVRRKKVGLGKSGKGTFLEGMPALVTDAVPSRL